MKRSQTVAPECLVALLLFAGSSASAQIGRMPAMPSGNPPASRAAKPSPKPKPAPRKPRSKTAPASAGGGAAAAESENAVEMKYWASIEDSTDPEDYRQYIKNYPNGAFVDIANSRIRKFTSPAPKPPAPAPAQPAANVSSEIAERTIAAMGGPAFRNQTSFVGVGTATIYNAGTAYTAKSFIGIELFPESYVAELVFDALTLRIGTNGTVGWTKTGDAVQDDPERATEHRYYGFNVLRRLGSGTWRAVDGPDQVLEGRAVKTFGVADAEQHMTLFFVDPTTFLPLGIAYQWNNATVVTEYSDYRSVDGLKVPFRFVEYRDSAKTAECQLTNGKANVPVDRTLFGKP